MEDLDNRGAETYCYRNSSHMNIERARESTRTWGGGRGGSSLGYCFFFRRDSPQTIRGNSLNNFTLKLCFNSFVSVLTAFAISLSFLNTAKGLYYSKHDKLVRIIFLFEFYILYLFKKKLSRKKYLMKSFESKFNNVSLNSSSKIIIFDIFLCNFFPF